MKHNYGQKPKAENQVEFDRSIKFDICFFHKFLSLLPKIYFWLGCVPINKRILAR